jgi:hypothetical protein
MTPLAAALVLGFAAAAAGSDADREREAFRQVELGRWGDACFTVSVATGS